MGALKNKWILLTSLSLVKTLRFNLTYFSFSDALRFPVFISRKVSFSHLGGHVKLEGEIRAGMIRLGFKTIGVFDYNYSRTLWDVYGTVVFKGVAEIGQGAKICTGPKGVLLLGDSIKITAQSTLISYYNVQIGSDCLISWDVLIMDTDFHSLYDKQGNRINQPKPVIIGNHVWIGCRCLLLKGTVIPNACVIAANSLVNGVLDVEGVVYAGNPARPVKEGVTWNQ